MSELATINTEQAGQRVIITVDGEVDPSNARAVGREITDAVPNDALAVVLDLTAVEYLDSSGVQMIFELAERLEVRQQKLVVVAPPEAACRRVLDIVALDATAPVVDSRDAARAQLCGDGTTAG